MSMVSFPSSSSKSKANSSTDTDNSGSPSQIKKIPRPPNSFLIYRKERAKGFAGLVATQLSTKLADAWKKETDETRKHYARLAAIAKQEHVLQHPDYKFTPIKRGTGKRALALAAIANAAKKATDGSIASPSSLSSSSSSSGKKPLSRARNGSLSSSLAFGGAYPTEDPSDRASLSNRPRRNAQRPRRFSSTSPYSYSAACSAYSKRASYIASEAVGSSSSPLFFHPYEAAPWVDSQNATFQSQGPMGSPASSATSYCSEFSTHRNGFEDTFGDEKNNESEDIDGEGEYEEDDSTRQISQAFGQMLSHSSQSVLSLPSPPYQEEPSLFLTSTFPLSLAMESFEPECLARDDAHWGTTSGFFPAPSTPSMSRCSSTSLPSSPFGGYLTPSYEECGSPLHFPVTSSAFISQGIEVLDSSADLPTPLATPLNAPMILASQRSPAILQLSSFPFEMQPAMVNQDLMMSPALSSCSARSPPMTRSLPEAQKYMASALEWL